MSKVYVVHEAIHNGQPVYDTSPAEAFGQRIVLLKTNGAPNGKRHFLESIGWCVDEIYEKLSDFTDDDYLVLTGSPILIAAAAAVAACHAGGVLNVLCYDDRDKQYTPVVLQLWDENEDDVDEINQ